MIKSIVKIKDVCEFIRGLTYSKNDEAEFSNNAVLRATNIDLDSNKLNLSDIRYIDDSVHIKADKKVRLNDILICTASGSKSHLGKVALIDQELDMAFGGFMAVLRAKSNINPKFLFAFFKSQIFVSHVFNTSDGANINNLKFSQFEDLEINLPPLLIQQKIVTKLDAMLVEIEKAVAAAKANIKNAEDLFQNYLSDIEAPMSSLGEHVTIKTGKLDSNASVEGGKFPFFTCSKEIFLIDDYAFDCEAVLLAGNNASGDFNVKHYKGKFNAYQRTYVITIDAENKLTYKYLYFQLINALKKFKKISVGANTKFLKIGMIRNLQFPLPKMNEQLEILRRLSVIEDNKELLMKTYFHKLDLLNALKQSILKQAFAGELVKE